MNGNQPTGLGKILIEIDIDTAQYRVAFSNMDTFKLLNPQEAQLMMSAFHVVCIINEIKNRRAAAESKIIPASQFPPINPKKLH